MPERTIGTDVFTEALERLIYIYARGHRVLCSFSAGKDSGVVLELAIMAAQATGNLPVEVVLRDEEIMLPGTYEYAERMAALEDVSMSWVYACQPVINCFARKQPYFWVFDPELDPSEWVRQPPSFARRIEGLSIEYIGSLVTHPPPEGKNLVVLQGLRVAESTNRRMGIQSSGRWLTRGFEKDFGKVVTGRPIYDWKAGDVWRAIKENGWDYNSAYDIMSRVGLSAHKMRIGPPTMTAAGVEYLSMAKKVWPRWFSRVAERLQGVRSAANFGRRAIEPMRRTGEAWETCFQRVCISEAPDWIAERAEKVREVILKRHAGHSIGILPDFRRGRCHRCANLGSWEDLCKSLYMGDPFSLKQQCVPYVEPEFFREGAGRWDGKPTW